MKTRLIVLGRRIASPGWRLATRLTVAFVLVAAIAGTLAALVLSRTLLLGLDDGVDVGLRARAATLATSLSPSAAGRSPSAAALAGVSRTTGITQVLAGNGGAVLTSSDDAGSLALLDPDQVRRAAQGTYIVDADRELPVSAGAQERAVSVRLLGAPIGRTGDVIVVGEPRETINDAVSETALHLFVAGLVLIVLAALGARALITAALRPVERARLQAEAASRRDAPVTLEDPGGDDEFARLVHTFNALLGRQQELLEAERSFTADAGHELRTPLAILSGELELAARPSRTHAEVVEAVRVAREETDRLIRLTEQLLTLASSDDRTLVSRSSADLSAVVTAATSAVAPLARAAGVTLRSSVGDGVTASIDSDRIRLAAENLLRNAIRFTPAGTTVEVTLEVVGRRVTLTVRDQGPGFTAEFLPHAFDRFRRDDAARGRGDDTAGTGLGLAIVRAVAEAHDGTVFARNAEPGPGAVVGFTVPTGGSAAVPTGGSFTLPTGGSAAVPNRGPDV